MQQRMTFWYLLGYSLSKGLAKTFSKLKEQGLATALLACSKG